MPDAPTYEQLVALVAELSDQVAVLSERNAELSERIVELERLLSADSSNSSRPPSLDTPWEKKPAKKRSSRTRSGRKPGKQPGASSSSRSLVDDPDRVVVIEPECCSGCEASLAGGVESGRERRQVVDVRPVPPPEITEYQRVSKICSGCGMVTTPTWDTGDDCVEVVSAPGSPVRTGPGDPGPVRLVDLRAFPARGPGPNPAGGAVRNGRVDRVPRGHPGARRPEAGEEVPGAPARPAGQRPGAACR